MRHVQSPRALLVLALATLLACSKKQPPPPEPAKEAPAQSASAMAKTEPSAAPSASSSAPAVDDAIEGEFTAIESFAFPEGKILAIPKFKPADKDAAKAHAAALQTEFEAIVKEGYKEQNRFNASFIPATYILMMHPAKPGKPPAEGEPEIWTMLVAEGTSVVRQPVASIGPQGELGSTNAWALMQTSRGWFTDTHGDGSLLYILRRSGRPMSAPASTPSTWECDGKLWHPETGGLEGGAVPDYPGRGKDLDGDGKNEFPTRRFAFEMPLFRMTTNPSSGEVCNLATDLALTVGVLGATSMIKTWTEKSEAMAGFYERRYKAAKKRADKIRAWAGPDAPKTVTRKTSELRMTNECALDVAQTASELFVYARTLGESEADAIAQADALMKGFALKLHACTGVEKRSHAADDATDYWPELRKALLAAKLEAVSAEKPAASASAAPQPSTSAAPSSSASK